MYSNEREGPHSLSEQGSVVHPIEIYHPESVVRLEQYTPGLAAEIFELIAGIREHLSQFGDPTSAKYPDLQSVRDSIQPPETAVKLRFVVRDSSNVCVGTVNLTPADDPEAMEVGYYVGRQFGWRGLATAAVRLVCGWAFRERGLARIVAHTHPHNIASQRVLEKAGFCVQREGRTNKPISMTVVMDSTIVPERYMRFVLAV